MSMMVSFVLSFFPRDVLDEILNLIESVSEDFPSYSSIHFINVSAGRFNDVGLWPSSPTDSSFPGYYQTEQVHFCCYL